MRIHFVSPQMLEFIFSNVESLVILLEPFLEFIFSNVQSLVMLLEPFIINLIWIDLPVFVERDWFPVGQN